MILTSVCTGGLRFETDIRGHRVVVDVPENLGGTDTGPMPPELVVTSLGTCVGIYVVNFCRKHHISTEGLKVHTEWEKGTNPSRIAKMDVFIELPAGVPGEKYDAFMETVRKCTVHNTFCQIPEITLTLAGV